MQPLPEFVSSVFSSSLQQRMQIIHEEDDIPSLFNTAYQKVAAVTKAVSGFAETGIHALNLDVIE
jgi:hypothetical protein